MPLHRLPTMLKRVKEMLQSSKGSKPKQSKDPHPSGTQGLTQATSTLNRLANICSSVSILIPGLKEAVNVAMEVVNVALVRRTWLFSNQLS